MKRHTLIPDMTSRTVLRQLQSLILRPGTDYLTTRHEFREYLITRDEYLITRRENVDHAS